MFTKVERMAAVLLAAQLAAPLTGSLTGSPSLTPSVASAGQAFGDRYRGIRQGRVETGEAMTGCPVRADDVEHLRKRTRTARTTAVIPHRGAPLPPSLNGTAGAVPEEPCVPRYRS